MARNARAASPLAADTAVDKRIPTPLYHQIYLVLRDQIAQGAFGAEGRVPSEIDIGRRYGVSRITAKRALDELAADGLVTRSRGRGTSVTGAMPAPPVAASVEGLLENLLAMGLKTQVRLLELATVAAPDEIARLMGIAAGEPVQHAVRVRSLHGEPFSHLTTFVPDSIGRSIKARDLASTPVLQLLERCGVVVSRAEQTITAVLAEPAIAGALGTSVGAPLLKITRQVYDQSDRVVELIFAIYRPDRYQYQMKLTRVRNSRAAIWTPAR